MRIISGTAKGRKLKTPENDSTRPTEDRIKENIFNLLHGPFWSAKVLDLFAGTGNIGLEFLSRGADLVWFNDISSSCKKIITRNLEMIGFEDNYKVFSEDYEKVLQFARDSSMVFDYIYLDPPYEKSDFYHKSISMIQEYGLLQDGGSLVIEAPHDLQILESESLKIRKFKKYRSTGVWILDKCEDC